jgi:hypothetical protein
MPRIVDGSERISYSRIQSLCNWRSPVSIKSLIVLSSFLVSAVAFAQPERLGTVGDVDGLVTVTDGATGGVVAPGAPIFEGMRFITTSGGDVTLRFINGCTVVLKPNESLTVDQRATCKELLASVTPVGGVVAVGGGTGGSFGSGLLAVTGLTLVGFGLDRALGDSPNLSGK